MKVALAGIALLSTTLGLPVRAELRTAGASPVRAKMPEPLLTESITDLDDERAGEVEVDVNGSAFRRTSAVRQWQSSVEVEWRALERLGLALDLGVGRALGQATSPVMSVRPAASCVLTHSQPLDFHLMAEVSARVSHDATEDVQDPGDGALPLSGGIRFGIRHGLLTVRTFLGAGAGGHSAHAVPLRAQAAVLAEFGREGRLGFAGFEMDYGLGPPHAADAGRKPHLAGRPPSSPVRPRHCRALDSALAVRRCLSGNTGATHL